MRLVFSILDCTEETVFNLKSVSQVPSQVYTDVQVPPLAPPVARTPPIAQVPPLQPVGYPDMNPRQPRQKVQQVQPPPTAPPIDLDDIFERIKDDEGIDKKIKASVSSLKIPESIKCYGKKF